MFKVLKNLLKILLEVVGFRIDTRCKPIYIYQANTSLGETVCTMWFLFIGSHAYNKVEQVVWEQVEQ
jgi:hypothetical protein